jgi:hypothetical protein
MHITFIAKPSFRSYGELASLSMAGEQIVFRCDGRRHS